MSPVATGDMSSVATGDMSSVATGDMKQEVGGHFRVTFSTFVGLFRGCPRSVPMRLRHRRKVFPRHSRGVSGYLFDIFSKRCSGRSPGICPALPDSFCAFLEKSGLVGWADPLVLP